MEPDKTSDAGEGRCAVPPQAVCDADRAPEGGFELGEPALVCDGASRSGAYRFSTVISARWQRAAFRGAPVGHGLLSWAKQHVEWSLADDTTVAVPDDGVLMLVIDTAGQAAMSTGPYERLASTAREALIYRALDAHREADRTGVAPEVLAAHRAGALVLGVGAEDPLAGVASLAAQLAEARGVRIERDPALPYRALAGACVGALLLLSDEHGVVAAGDAPDVPADDLVDLLVAGYEKLRG